MNKTYFGFTLIEKSEKNKRVREIFDSVASKYDLMNDLMSGGLHRWWKFFTIKQACIRPGYKVLDIAAGSGDLTEGFLKATGKQGEVWLTDINANMLAIGRNRLIDKGFIPPVIQCDAEKLPFEKDYFDLVSVSFGLRNMTNKEHALLEMNRVLKPGGKLLILEFSKIAPCLEKIYDYYSMNIIPWLGEKISGDKKSYQYLVESIRTHPDQKTLKTMIENAGLSKVKYFDLSGGIVALHIGRKF